MNRRISILGMTIVILITAWLGALRPVCAADLAPGLSPELYKQLDGMVVNALTAYSSGNYKQFYADYSKSMAGLATEQAFNALYTNIAKKNFGNYRSKLLNTKRSTVPGPVGLLVYDVQMDKGAAVLSVNFVKEGSGYKIQQVQFSKQ